MWSIPCPQRALIGTNKIAIAIIREIIYSWGWIIVALVVKDTLAKPFSPR